MVAVDRDAGAISELALSATDLADFEQRCFSFLKPILGFDTACSVWSGHDGTVRHVTALEYEEARLLRDFPRYMSELLPRELLGFAAERPALDVNVIASQRRARLTVYRELLDPFGVSVFVTNVWHCRYGVFGYHFGRIGRSPPFRGERLTRLHQLAPVMKLAQALLTSDSCQTAPNAREWWSAEWSLSPRERDISALVARGFRNAEIAALLRISPNTVRNHLASVFRKADVSTRAELVFVMTSSDPRHSRRPGAQPWSAPLTARSITGNRTP
jgi:DNA-binding CsgD family transcriptional regulator